MLHLRIGVTATSGPGVDLKAEAEKRKKEGPLRKWETGAIRVQAHVRTPSDLLIAMKKEEAEDRARGFTPGVEG